MSQIDFVAMIPYRGKLVVKTEKIPDDQTPIRIYGGGEMFHLRTGWQVFSAWTIRGRGMALIPPRKQGQSEKAWRRTWIRGFWGGSGRYEKVLWNKGRDFNGTRMRIDILKNMERAKKALEESGLIHFRQIQYGAEYFVFEEVDHEPRC